MFEEYVEGHQVISDGKTVWVNSRTSGASIARFSVVGGRLAMVDVHREPERQAAEGECLDCAHGACSIELWDHFKRALRTHYSIEISDRHKPEALNDKTETKEDERVRP